VVVGLEVGGGRRNGRSGKEGEKYAQSDPPSADASPAPSSDYP